MIQIVVLLVQSVPEPTTSYMAAFRVLLIGKALRSSLSCHFLLLSIRQSRSYTELLPTHSLLFNFNFAFMEINRGVMCVGHDIDDNLPKYSWPPWKCPVRDQCVCTTFHFYFFMRKFLCLCYCCWRTENRTMRYILVLVFSYSRQSFWILAAVANLNIKKRLLLNVWCTYANRMNKL